VSTRGKLPELTLINCTFENFFAGYESLIHVETDNIWYVGKQVPRYELKDTGSEAYVTYLATTGVDRGIQLLIHYSTFKNSRFCRGLIVYRKMNKVENQEQLLNLT
jgi:hypothetical protein